MPAAESVHEGRAAPAAPPVVRPTSAGFAVRQQRRTYWLLFHTLLPRFGGAEQQRQTCHAEEKHSHQRLTPSTALSVCRAAAARRFAIARVEQFAAVKDVAEFVGSPLSDFELCCLATEGSKDMGSHTKKERGKVTSRFGKWKVSVGEFTCCFERRPQGGLVKRCSGAHGYALDCQQFDWNYATIPANILVSRSSLICVRLRSFE